MDLSKPLAYRMMPKTLDDYVIGQEEAKKTLSVAVYNHYKRVASKAGLRIATGDEGACEGNKQYNKI